MRQPDGGRVLLTQSRLRAYRECPRLHHLKYIERWRAVRESEALRFGTLVHRGLEAWWRAWRRGEPALALGDALAAVAGRAGDAYEQAKVEEVLRGYDTAWAVDAVQYEVLGVEVPFEAPLLNPETWRSSATWRLAGKVDLLLRRRLDGRVLVCEHKTTSEAMDDPAAAYWARLQMDAQISAYVIGAESLGHEVTDTLYDVALRPGLRPLFATPPENRKYRKDGGLYAGQREADETPDEYRTRVRSSIEESPARYFQRRLIPRTESQIRDFLSDAWQQAAAMRLSERMGHAPRNPDACHRFGQCAYWEACSTGSSPAALPSLYGQIQDVNPELQAQEV
ncbi:MAG: PD-(D/E)XK nuclease family protein [Planctomycetaceae bacterium]|nr:PD-(D/E)XK nuclease family protein [Planctomycetota bacterium]NUN51411.1 PD-(D/E)XK nuclease family protein [Planctomycetaceae bacterium]